MARYIFVTGGVLSGLGKGTIAASVAKLLQFRGFSVGMVKCDPYLNVDAGTMNPIEHGENFVTEEVWDFEPVKGYRFRIAEIDQDFGTYERFTGENIHPSHNITSGQIYLTVILRERVGEYLGKTVQIIPHITDEIKKRITSIAEKGYDIVIVEIGGTVGDIEGMPFLEAVRQLRNELGPGDSLLIHVTYVPYLKTVRQLKTKPTQHSVQRLLQAGLTPDIIVARSELPLDESSRRKIALFCGVPIDAVISAPDLPVTYSLPIVLEQQGMGELILSKFSLKEKKKPNDQIKKWEQMVLLYLQHSDSIEIALVGKYTKIFDSYISITEALRHAGAHEGVDVNITFIDAEREEELRGLERFDGILLTPGFGKRASEGMIKAAEIALDKKIPFLGICFGGQLGIVAFARKIMKWEDANSTEINPKTSMPIVDLLPEQKSIMEKGGTMRLGGIKIRLIEGTILHKAYRKSEVVERFRHRYHIIKDYTEAMKEHGLIVNAIDEFGNIVGYEVEWHPFYVGVQFHPEYKSRPWAPSPPYEEFIKVAKNYKAKKKNN